MMVELGQHLIGQRADQRGRGQVGALIIAEPEEVLSAVDPVKLLTGAQRVLHSQRMKRPAVKDPAAAKAEVRQNMTMGVDDAKDRAVGEFLAADLALGVEAKLGKLGAAQIGRAHV